MSDHTPEQPQQQNTAPLFSVGERQYDAEAAKKKIENADLHISTIETENATLKQELDMLKAQQETSSKLDQVLEAMRTKQESTQPATEPTTAQPSGLNEEDLVNSLLEKLTPKIGESLEQAKAMEVAVANETSAMEAAQAKYGKEYESKLRATAQSLGLDDNAVRTMAQSNPILFKKTFDLGDAPKVVTAPTNSVNVQAQPTGQDELNYGKPWSKDADLQQLLKNREIVARQLSGN